MSAEQDTRDAQRDLERRGLAVSFDDAQTLRRAAKTLHRWAELECGDGNDYASWSIERDEETGIPYFVTYPHRGETYRRKIADREAGALRRIAAVCQRIGAHYYHQGDPRGAALYIDPEQRLHARCGGVGMTQETKQDGLYSDLAQSSGQQDTRTVSECYYDLGVDLETATRAVASADSARQHGRHATVSVKLETAEAALKLAIDTVGRLRWL